MTHSLDRLSDRERDLLILLAQGHTAKTIAESRSLSLNAVNEHLRSARRKTGAPSSRDLARRVVAGMAEPSQENRDDFFGLEDPILPAHQTRRQGVAPRAVAALKRWRVTMFLTVLLVAGVLAYNTSAPGQAGPSNPSDPRSSPAAAETVRPDVVYQVFFREGSELLGSPTVIGQFGREVRVEIPNVMRVAMSTEAADQNGEFRTSARMQVFHANAWQPPKEMSMKSNLAVTPSFEHTVDGTPYRFVIMPRLVVSAAD